MNRTVKRLLTTAGATVGGLALLTGTASAHFCAFAAPEGSKITNGQAWNTGEETVAWITEATKTWSGDCALARDAVVAQVKELDASGHVFMGPGLLAGGTLMNGSDNTPAHFAYLTTFFEVPETCFA